MQKRTLLAAAWLAFSLKTAAQTAPCTALPQATETMHVNHLRMPYLRPGAYLGGYPNKSETAVTAGYNGLPQPTAGLFASSIWVGGLDEAGQMRVSATTFPSDNDFHFVAGPFGLNASECGRWDRFWSVSRTALAAHRTDVADGNLDDPLPEILAWPGRGNPHFAAQNGFDLPNVTDEFAPFFDADGNGIYDPFAGDFPHPNGVDTTLVPGKIVWNLFSDPQPGVFVPPGMGGFEYQWTAWATACADTSDVLNDAVFFSLRLTNRSGTRMDSVTIGLWGMLKIGNFGNDFLGTRPDMATLYGYNSYQNDSLPYIQNWPLFNDPNVFRTNPPAYAWTGLNYPLFKTMYYQSSAYDGNLKLKEPHSVQQHYQYLNGQWLDGKPLVSEGTGYSFMSMDTASFIFDGNPLNSTGWIPDTNLFTRMDYQLASVHLGTLPPNASKTIDYAFSYHRGPGLDHLQNVGYLFQRVADLRQRYAQNFADDCASEPLCQADDCVWPGDTNRDGIVNHCDILPIGVALGKTGQSRPGFTTWEGQTAPDWGQLFNQTYDLKHTDANGDGTVGLPDAGVVRDFYGLKKPGYQAVDDYQAGNEIYIKATNSTIIPDNVQPDQSAIFQFVIEPNAGMGIKGFVFTVEWDSLYWKKWPWSASNNLFRIDSNRISFRFFTENEVEFSHFNVTTDFPTQISPGLLLALTAKSLPPGTPPLTYIRLKNIKGIRADGSEIPLGSWPRQFCFGGGCTVGTAEDIENQSVRVFPNPASHAIHVETAGAPVLWLALLDAAGRTVRAPFLEENSPAAICPTDGLPGGLYFLKVKTRDGLAVRKLVVE